MKSAHKSPPPRSLKRSFTLIELLIIVAILGILAGLVVVAVNPAKRSNQARVSGALQFSQQIYHQLTFELAGQWDFNDPTNPSQAADTSGNNNHGTITGATYNCDDTPYHVVGQTTNQCSLSFDGMGDYVSTPNSASLNPASAITLSLWFKHDTNQAGDVGLIAKANNSQYQIRIDNDNQTRFYVYTIPGPTQNTIGFTTSGNIKLGKWHHIAGTYDSSTGTGKIYLDGEQKASAATISGNINTTTQTGAIGGSAAALNFDGLIDDVRIYSTALTKTEIQHLYAQAAPRYQIALTKSPE